MVAATNGPYSAQTRYVTVRGTAWATGALSIAPIVATATTQVKSRFMGAS
ncbi:hypothetical protein MM1S1540310_0130 [Mycobacteroides abscessus subsp. bolletii 1S-154-0310]|nr:hypothetical protein MM1S1510930_5561 [Mycobacteroides abscessus subsp. bolletii 1S-151-0930]EIU82578.1 hypothetical protein MM1S1530915_0115 [Mycobacteroides abscessus subsp. bolletii 1S-153-0915]EIU84776.1 hypothetical protein MM1S1540310_0130 [Mycobacteroides abscessus subsp. bolletii 1S-154-0310]